MSLIQKLRHRREVRRLLKELGSKGDKAPKLVYDYRVPRDNGYYNFVTHEVGLPPDIKRETEEALLAHELAHATGLIGTRGNKVTKAIGGASAAITNNVGINALVQMFGGTPVAAAAYLARLAEEGQANVRGSKALNKIKKGKMSDKEKATFTGSMGSYLIGLPVGAVVPPKAIQVGLDRVHPGFAENHKVLYDYIADACQ